MYVSFLFQAYGMSALPLNLIKGTTSAAYERLENTEDIEEVEQHLLRIKSKVWSWCSHFLNFFLLLSYWSCFKSFCSGKNSGSEVISLQLSELFGNKCGHLCSSDQAFFQSCSSSYFCLANKGADELNSNFSSLACIYGRHTLQKLRIFTSLSLLPDMASNLLIITQCSYQHWILATWSCHELDSSNY